MTGLINFEKYNATKHEVRCNLCGENQTELLCFEQRFKTGIPVVICKKCGLVYLNPRWSDRAYSDFYKEDYIKLSGEGEVSAEKIAFRQRIHGSRILDFCDNFISKNANIIDIGCAAGGVLWIFREALQGEVYGIEPSVGYSKYAREKLGINVHTGILELCDLEQRKFDLAIITQTLNHMLDPLGVLRQIYQILNPQGKLFVEVQNCLEYAKISPISTQVDHTYYFCLQTLECMLQKAGFFIIKMEIDTAKSSQLVHPHMWNCGAWIHMRFLALKVEPPDNILYPDYRSIKETINLALAQWKLAPISRKIIWFCKKIKRSW